MRYAAYGPTALDALSALVHTLRRDDREPLLSTLRLHDRVDVLDGARYVTLDVDTEACACTTSQ